MERKLWVSIATAAIGASLLVVATATAAPSRSAKPTKAGAGGTIVSELDTDVDYTDPQLSYYVPMWEIEYATACKLYNYPDKEAPVGGTAVPEVSAGTPKISADGKTYTFTVKPGFRFSNGEAVTALSFKRAIDRLVNPKMASTGSGFATDIIVGAQDALDGKTSGVSGVIAKGNRLTVKLTHPAPDLLARLAMPFFQAIDTKTAGTIDPQGVNAYASCGPYYISARTPGRSITLKRNTFYKGARPHNAAGIQVNIGNSLDVIYQNVAKGTTDYDAAGLPPALRASVAKQYGLNKKQFFTRNALGTDYLALNHDPGRAFHNNPQLAKAVNYAVDRRAYTAQRGAFGGSPTNRILPPGIAGNTKKTQNFPNLYPFRGITPANVAKAKALAAGHTGDGKIEMWAPNAGAGVTQAQVVQYDLKQIGLNVTLKLLPRAQQFTTARNRSQATYDINWSGWGADYSDPYDFINVLLDGTTIGPTANNNDAYYNNAKFNKAMAKASLIVASGPRNNAYNALDKAMMTEDPPWAPMLNRTYGTFLSSHVSNFTWNPVFQVDYATFIKK
jgi:ABC-type oligopeptide transport system substrate-binding subunit